MTARFLVGDVHDRLGDIPDHSIDLVLTSPPFLALRSYLPDSHPDKAKEIGSEPTPAAYLDVLLQLTAEWGRVLAPHGSIAVELGDTYAGSGGAGGDYEENGLREGQPRFRQGYDRRDGRTTMQRDNYEAPLPVGSSGGPGWPLPKSLACIPQLYQVALAYGINPLTGQPSPAGRWRVRTLKPWIRSNPPVGALGDKERPATSYVIVACRAQDRFFDLDTVRTAVLPHTAKYNGGTRPSYGERGGQGTIKEVAEGAESNPAGAPPRDWWHHVDAVLDAELAVRRDTTGKDRSDEGPQQYTPGGQPTRLTNRTETAIGAQGVHLRRALERAGILQTQEALDVSPKGYSGAHYAVWPPELVRLLVDEMCPQRVCATCGQPSRRLVDVDGLRGVDILATQAENDRAVGLHGPRPPMPAITRTTVGWSDCGHGTWRPGHVLDPFAGSGTTLAVATGMGRQATGIDLDSRNADLAVERCGMFLNVDQPVREAAT